MKKRFLVTLCIALMVLLVSPAFASTAKKSKVKKPKTPVMKNWDENASNGFGLQWKILKDESKILGYQIQWANNKSFKNAHVKNMNKGYIGWSSLTMGLKHGKTYYCRIRSVAKQNKKLVYSRWSKSKHKKYTGETQSLSINEDVDFTKYASGSKKTTTKKKSTKKKGSSGSKKKDIKKQKIICGNCGGKGHTSITIMKTVLISINPYRTIQQPVTNIIPCASCGGRGYTYIY